MYGFEVSALRGDYTDFASCRGYMNTKPVTPTPYTLNRSFSHSHSGFWATPTAKPQMKPQPLPRRQGFVQEDAATYMGPKVVKMWEALWALKTLNPKPYTISLHGPCLGSRMKCVLATTA